MHNKHIIPSQEITNENLFSIDFARAERQAFLAALSSSMEDPAPTWQERWRKHWRDCPSRLLLLLSRWLNRSSVCNSPF